MMERQDWATWSWRLGPKATNERPKRKKVQNVGKTEPKRENKGQVREQEEKRRGCLM